MLVLVPKISFNPRSPRGGATFGVLLAAPYLTFQSTLPARGSDYGCTNAQRCQRVSIHAPREGERQYGRWHLTRKKCFNPRSPRGGATDQPGQARDFAVFQSTLPARGSDLVPVIFQTVQELFQSTLPARGSDIGVARLDTYTGRFNPRSPRGGATSEEVFTNPLIRVSIHAPREGERLSCPSRPHAIKWFQSTLPARGSDKVFCLPYYPSISFQSTLPARGSDIHIRYCLTLGGVSIHAPREGERLRMSLLLP